MKSAGKILPLETNKTILGRTLFLMIVCGVLSFTALGARLFKIMIIGHEFYGERAELQQTVKTRIPASRGTITDRNGTKLAVSTTSFSVYICPFQIRYYGENTEKIASILHNTIGADVESVRKRAEKLNSWYQTVRTKISPEEADALMAELCTENIMSVHVEEDVSRVYPLGKLACHVVGFVGTDGYGLDGIEALYNKELEGTPGSIGRLAAANGAKMPNRTFENYTDPTAGNDIELTIDAAVQSIAERCMEQAIADYDVQNGGCCIVMGAKTGEILALTSFDNYDLNSPGTVGKKAALKIDTADGDERNRLLVSAQLSQWRNMAVCDTYEPGSVFKTITLAAALDSGAVSMNDRFYCSGTVNVIGRKTPVHCWKHTGHGSQTLAQTVMHSCNAAFVNIGLSVGAERFYEYVRRFGLFEKTGVDLIGETNSQWWSEEVFKNEKNLSQLAAASFGQTFNITPIQLAAAFSAAVNGGELKKPFVVKRITAPDGKTVYENNGETVSRAVSEETSQKVRAILEAVVSDPEGTGKNAAVTGYRIGGKTGTSEKTGKKTENGTKEYIVSFCGTAPADDPEIVVLVLLDTPSDKTGLYISGGNMAAPTVGNIFAEILPYLGYERTEEPSENVSVPDVAEMKTEDAQKCVFDSGLKVRVSGAGETVYAQLPDAGAEIADGSTVVLFTEPTEEINPVCVPSFDGMTVCEAVAAAQECGLYLSVRAVNEPGDTAIIWKQSHPAGEMTDAGSIIEVSLAENVCETDLW